MWPFDCPRVVVGRHQDGSLEIFGMGSDAQLWHILQNPPPQGGWSAWAGIATPPGGVQIVGPIAVGGNDEFLSGSEIFGIGSDAQLWSIVQNPASPNGWSAWAGIATPPGGVQIVGAIAVGPNEDVSFRGIWYGLGRATMAHLSEFAGTRRLERVERHRDPAWRRADYRTDRRRFNSDLHLQVFGMGSDAQLWSIVQNPASPNGWSAWAGIATPPGGVQIVGAIAVGSNQDGRLEIFGMGSDAQLWHILQNPPAQAGWSGWGAIAAPPGGVQIIGPIAVGFNNDLHLQVFGMGSDSQLWNITQNPPPWGGWSGWGGIAAPPGGVQIIGLIAVGSNEDGRVEIFGMGSDAQTLEHRFEPAVPGQPRHMG